MCGQSNIWRLIATFVAKITCRVVTEKAAEFERDWARAAKFDARGILSALSKWFRVCESGQEGLMFYWHMDTRAIVSNFVVTCTALCRLFPLVSPRLLNFLTLPCVLHIGLTAERRARGGDSRHSGVSGAEPMHTGVHA